MATKAYQKQASSSIDSPRAPEVGEIDTRPPFESVRAAVSLFGEGAPRKDPPPIRVSKPSIDDRAVDKETHLHLSERELHKLTENIKNAEATKSQAIQDLHRSKIILQQLSSKLQDVTTSKDSATEETQAAKRQAKEEQIQQKPFARQTSWIREMEDEQDRYKIVSDEAVLVKQKLRKLQQDFDSLLEAKVAAFQEAADAQHASKRNRERAGELVKDIAGMQDSIAQLNQATVETEQERDRIVMDNDANQKSHTSAIQDAENKLVSLRGMLEPASSIGSLQTKLIDLNTEIAILQQEMRTSISNNLATADIIKQELANANLTLRDIATNQSSLRSLENSLKLQLEELKEKHSAIENGETEIESRTTALQATIEKTKIELETAVSVEKEARVASGEMISQLENFSMKSTSAREEVQLARRTVEGLVEEAEKFQDSANSLEEKLVVAVREAEEARSAEKMALDKIRSNACTHMDDGIKITVSAQKFESLTRKAEESEELAEKKVVAALSMINSIKSKEEEASKKIEEVLREIEAVRAAREDALKQANMAEAAKHMVENELRKWRDEEKKKTRAHTSLVIDIPDTA